MFDLILDGMDEVCNNYSLIVTDIRALNAFISTYIYI